MDFSTLNIVRGIFTVFVVLGAVQPSQSFQFTKVPDNPFIVVEGVSNLLVALEWEFTLSSSESVNIISINRSRLGEVAGVTIAGKVGHEQLRVTSDFTNDYAIRLPSTLLINIVTNADEYIYTFSVTLNGQFPPNKNLTRIIVFVPPKITQIPARKTAVSIGQNVTLQCNASGDPLPNITWTRGGVLARDFNVSGNVLQLVHVQSNNAGSYRCTATNGYGSDATNIALVSINCPYCEAKQIGITLNQNWKSEYSNAASEEYKALESNTLSAIWGVYAGDSKGLSRVFIVGLRYLCPLLELEMIAL